MKMKGNNSLPNQLKEGQLGGRCSGVPQIFRRKEEVLTVRNFGEKDETQKRVRF